MLLINSAATRSSLTPKVKVKLYIKTYITLHHNLPVNEFTSNTSFKKSTTPIASKNTVMFATWQITTDDTEKRRWGVSFIATGTAVTVTIADRICAFTSMTANWHCSIVWWGLGGQRGWGVVHVITTTRAIRMSSLPCTKRIYWNADCISWSWAQRKIQWSKWIAMTTSSNSSSCSTGLQVAKGLQQWWRNEDGRIGEGKRSKCWGCISCHLVVVEKKVSVWKSFDTSVH